MNKLAEELDAQRRKVDFDSYDISVQQMLSMVADGNIDIAPEYQRHFRWKDEGRSQLIESVFLGIPIPPLFMATNRDGTWEVVDGVQRLSTLIHYAGDDKHRKEIGETSHLTLKGLDKLVSLNGSTFQQLPQNIKTQFLLRPIKVVTLSDKSDSVVRFDLFERLNTGGVSLTDQEIRACVFRGEFNQFLAQLAQESDFRAVVKLPPTKREDRTNEECILRFFAFLHSYKSFDHSVVGFLNDYMKSANKYFDYDAGRSIFKDTFRQLAKLFPEGIYRGTRKSTPINLYEAVAVGAALAIQKNGRIARQRSTDWVSGSELHALTTGATNTKPMVVGRIEYCAKRFGWKA